MRRRTIQIGEPYGMATIEFSDGSEQDYLIYDETFAVELFQVACANLLEDEEFGAQIVTAECARLGGTPPEKPEG